ncbi:MAG: peptidoglycan-binding domain-containing protein [Chthoniobacterales bacterium]
MILLLIFLPRAFADDVMRETQQKLKKLGLYTGDVDGQSGSQTSAAIRRYQVYNKLKVTGELNAQTSERLGISESPQPHKATPAASKPESSRPVRVTNPPSKLQPQTAKAKEALKTLGYYHDASKGDSTKDLAEALKSFQRNNHLKISGQLDKQTLQALGPYESQ